MMFLLTQMHSEATRKSASAPVYPRWQGHGLVATLPGCRPFNKDRNTPGS